MPSYTLILIFIQEGLESAQGKRAKFTLLVIQVPFASVSLTKER